MHSQVQQVMLVRRFQSGPSLSHSTASAAVAPASSVPPSATVVRALSPALRALSPAPSSTHSVTVSPAPTVVRALSPSPQPLSTVASAPALVRAFSPPPRSQHHMSLPIATTVLRAVTPTRSQHGSPVRHFPPLAYSVLAPPIHFSPVSSAVLRPSLSLPVDLRSSKEKTWGQAVSLAAERAVEEGVAADAISTMAGRLEAKDALTRMWAADVITEVAQRLKTSAVNKAISQAQATAPVPPKEKETSESQAQTDGTEPGPSPEKAESQVQTTAREKPSTAAAAVQAAPESPPVPPLKLRAAGGLSGRPEEPQERDSKDKHQQRDSGCQTSSTEDEGTQTPTLTRSQFAPWSSFHRRTEDPNHAMTAAVRSLRGLRSEVGTTRNSLRALAERAKATLATPIGAEVIAANQGAVEEICQDIFEVQEALDEISDVFNLHPVKLLQVPMASQTTKGAGHAADPWDDGAVLKIATMHIPAGLEGEEIVMSKGERRGLGAHEKAQRPKAAVPGPPPQIAAPPASPRAGRLNIPSYDDVLNYGTPSPTARSNLSRGSQSAAVAPRPKEVGPTFGAQQIPQPEAWSPAIPWVPAGRSRAVLPPKTQARMSDSN